MWQEFKEFIAQGNVMDLAVGVILGSAFTAIVDSLVDSIIMPIIGVIIGGIDFSGLSITVGSAVIGYGAFIQAIINFLLIALVLFLMLKSFNVIRRSKEEEAEEEAEKDEQIQLLEDIKNELVSLNKSKGK